MFHFFEDSSDGKVHSIHLDKEKKENTYSSKSMCILYRTVADFSVTGYVRY